MAVDRSVILKLPLSPNSPVKSDLRPFDKPIVAPYRCTYYGHCVVSVADTVILKNEQQPQATYLL